MIVILGDVWRADCIACIGIDDEDDGDQLHVLPVGCEDTVDYEYESREELVSDFKVIVQKWEAELRAKP